MTIIKWLGGLFATLVIVLMLATIIIPRVVDPNDFRDEITKVVKQQTGRDLLLAGDLNLSVFPWLGIKTQQLSFSQPEQIGGDMISVETAQIRVKLTPLLSRRLEIDTVVLDQPKLRLITLNNGISSFTGLAEVDSQEHQTSSPPADAGAAVALVIQGLELTAGNLLWDDRQAGQSYEVKNLDLRTGNLIGDDFAELTASGEIIDSSAADPIGFELNGEARIDTDTLNIIARDLDASLMQGAQSLQLTLANMAFDQTDGLSVVDAALDLNAMLTDEASEPEQALALKMALPKLSYNFTNGKIAAESMDASGGYGKRDFSLAIPKLVANMQHQTASIDNLSIESADLNLSLNQLKVTKFVDKPSASGAMVLEPFNARRLLKDLEIDYVPAHEKALQNIGFKSNFKSGMQGAEFNNFELTLDQSTLQGAVEITDFTQLSMVFDLALDTLNLDSYLPVTTETQEEATSSAQALAAPLAAMKGINANGSFKAKQLISGGLELNDIDVQIVSTPGTLSITPKAKLYEGSLGGQVDFSEANGVTSLHVDNTIDLVSLAPMLTAADVSDQLSGIGTLGIDVVLSERNGVQSNEGTIKLLARDGAIKGIDVKKMIDGAYAQYQQLKGREQNEEHTGAEAETEGQNTGEEETGFAELLGTFYLKDNRLTNNDFALNAPLFRLAGSGVIDLAADNINYLLKVSVVNSSSGQGGASISELEGITIPIRLRGAISAPSYAIDMKALLAGLARKKLQDKKDQYIREKLGLAPSAEEQVEGVEGESQAEQKPLTKEQRKKELKRKLLEELFK